MVTAAPDIEKNRKSSVSISTPEGDHDQLIQKAVGEVGNLGHSVTADDAHPPATGPVPASPELAQVGAHRIGSEKFSLREEAEIKNRDVGDLLRWLKSLFVGGVSKIRHTPGRLFLKLRRQQITQGAKLTDKHDPSQLDIGN